MKKIVLWGMGNYTRKYLDNGYFKNCEIICFIDNDKKRLPLLNLPVYSPLEFIRDKVVYDYIIVSNMYTKEIIEQCVPLGFDLSKMIFAVNYGFIFKSEKLNPQQKEEDVLEISEKLYYDLLVQRKSTFSRKAMLTCSFDEIDEHSLIVNDNYVSVYQDDYMRYRTFELVASEIKRNGVAGVVAEAGVFRGDFAKLINETFTDNKIYLFDTFESFNKKEFEKEVMRGNCLEVFFDEFTNTDEEFVLNRMTYQENCIIRKGFFPDTALGLEDLRFSFVSIDMDLEESIYNSLEWFYPRLNINGYIFLHDYNNSFLQGVKSAVSRYEEKYGLMKKVPIPDQGGTLIITK